MSTVDWTADANDALTLSLVRAKEDKQVLGDEETYEEFHPAFTYPIYGEDEKIYGYQDLVIDLRFASGSLAQYLSVRYAEKLDASTTVDNVEGILKEFIPPDYDTDEEAFLSRVEEDAASFRPIGKLIHSYTRPAPSTSESTSATSEAVEFEVYHVIATWKDPGFREYHRRMQLFILLYIEAGSYINEDDDAWEFSVLSRKRQSGTETYHFIGYSSLYNFYCFPEKLRMRLSQFVIIPPYQRHGHGSELYHAIYNYVLSRPSLSELTVEDPAEAFEDLRDRNDLKMLLANEQFMQESFGGEMVSHSGGKVRKPKSRARATPMGASSGTVKGKGKMGPPVDKAWAEKWRTELKIAGRQFQRLVEMLILMHLDPADIRAARAYRLQVKERLYRFNFEILAQLEKLERLEKLEETFQSLREDYLRILAMIK
ncbi:acyl-CoA N-acyltransferase [Rhizopogon vinicolor AM-OR11-026]|uniref:Histone acetyltransferase type B catalytic subunit n=1 Tax=Rhizopogon vinicolor AM-OR11-026 TaxID=1314800 RepID=A0A1B7N9V5_9AGAM|nr:acyl-CoA N-acyltransferase [Rhizopogon vinicolor AM-OR11-026]